MADAPCGKDPNFMNPAELKSDRVRRLAEYERELSALESGRTQRDEGTQRLGSAPKTGKPRPDADTPCWADPSHVERETSAERWGSRARERDASGSAADDDALKGDALKGDALKGDDGFKGEAVEDDVPPMCTSRSVNPSYTARAARAVRRQAPQGDRRGRGQGGDVRPGG